MTLINTTRVVTRPPPSREKPSASRAGCEGRREAGAAQQGERGEPGHEARTAFASDCQLVRWHWLMMRRTSNHCVASTKTPAPFGAWRASLSQHDAQTRRADRPDVGGGGAGSYGSRQGATSDATPQLESLRGRRTGSGRTALGNAENRLAHDLARRCCRSWS
jgi:hypothetical protein